MSESDGENGYPKDCLQRFGDDLMVDLLAYLPFECVCNQWKRCVFRSQSVLTISYPLVGDSVNSFNSLNQLANKTLTLARKINEIAFESIVKKCAFIEKIRCDRMIIITNNIVELIGNYCHNLIELKACSNDGLSKDVMRKFGAVCGQRLKRLEMDMVFSYINSYDRLIESMQQFLASLPNLEHLSVSKMELFAKSDATLLPKLKSVELELEEGDTLSDVVIDKYKSNIKCLKLNISCDKTLDTDLIRRLNTITERWQEIQAFHLTLFEPNPNENILTAIGKLRNLIDLKIAIKYICEFSGSACLSAMKGCDCQSCLTLTGMSINYSFFADIDQYLPNLNCLAIHSSCVLTNTFLHSAAKLKQLIKLVFVSADYDYPDDPFSYEHIKSNADMTDEGVCDLIVSCPRLRVVDFDFMPHINSKTFMSLIEKANTNEKIRYEFYLRNKFEVELNLPEYDFIYEDRERVFEDDLLQQYKSLRFDLHVIRHMVPKNLEISIQSPKIRFSQFI